jgi:hypothetical protein
VSRLRWREVINCKREREEDGELEAASWRREEATMHLDDVRSWSCREEIDET